MMGFRSILGRGVFLWAGWIAAIAAVPLPAQDFTDDFDRANGAIDGDDWTVAAGEWNIADGALKAGPATVEQHVYFGSPPTAFPIGDHSFTVEWEFLIPDSQPVGRHAGVLLCMDQPGLRSNSSGYLVWWIDRGADRGLNLTRRDAGGFNHLVLGTAGPDEGPPDSLTVEITGPTIRVFADGALAIEFDDSRYRGGHFGLWTWSGANQEVDFENVEFTVAADPLVACFTAQATAGVDTPVTFDASCTQVNGGMITSYDWDFGDGDTASGEVVEHSFAFPDNYVVSLTVTDDQGNSETIESSIGITTILTEFEDDFDRAAGEVTGWTEFSGEWMINEDGQLRTQSTTESHIYVGDPSSPFIGEEVTIDFDIEFLASPADGVGRHASLFFFNADPISRWNTTGYSLWWIDRDSDFGMGLHRWTGGGLVELAVSKNTAPAITEPPRRWTITVEGPQITAYGDGILVFQVDDDVVPREGHVGLWAYSNGQDILFDNFRVREGVHPPEQPVPVVPCATATPGSVAEGETITFSAACSQIADGVDVTAYRWDFGDGESAEGESADHAYEFAGNYTATLTIEHSGGDPVAIEILVSVSGRAELPFFEDFSDIPAGTEIPGWTPMDDRWSITEDGALEVATEGAETHIWIGDPPVLFAGDLTIEFEIEFVGHNPPTDAVGKHASIFFFSAEPISRWDSESYDVWWIDREVDFGLGLHHWPLTPIPLLGGSGELFAEPPGVWRIEIDGPTIRLFGDDELVVEVEDEYRRSGFVGFWAYLNTQIVRFDNICIVEGPFEGSPDCGSPPDPRFVRGDINDDGAPNIADAIFLLNSLFGADAPPPECDDSADVNDDGAVNIADAIYELNHLFGDGGEPQSPFPLCGVDPTADALGCQSFENCP